MDEVVRSSKFGARDRMESKAIKGKKKSKKLSKDKKMLRKRGKKKSRKRRVSSSSDSSSSSADSDSSESSSSESSEDEKAKKRRKKQKKSKKKKKTKSELDKSKEVQVAIVNHVPEKQTEVDIGPHIDLKSSKIRAPMTKEEYEKQQSTLKWITDPETGRRRLIRGSGEIMEELVSKERHQAINKEATAADGNFFQSQSLSRARSMYD